jgi:hypothetical protein
MTAIAKLASDKAPSDTVAQAGPSWSPAELIRD